MNKLKHKIHAFTLLELLVTLALTTLIVALAYFAYSYLLQGLIKYRNINDQIEQHYTLRTYLENASIRSKDILRTPGGLKFSGQGADSRTIEIKEQYVLFSNENQIMDTLKLQVVESRFYWKGDSTLPDKSPVQKIKLKIRFTGELHTLIFEKFYDAETLIRLDSLYNSLK